MHFDDSFTHFLIEPASPGGTLVKDDRCMMDDLLDKLRSGETENRQRRERRQRRLQRDGDKPMSPTETTTDELKIDTTMITAEDLLKRLQTDSIAL